MLKKISNSFILAFHNIRSHFFHTILSILGIVIGVAALVSILSLIDGMEKYAKEQITKTTSLNSIMIQPQWMKHVDSVAVRKDSIDLLTYVDFKQLQSSLSRPAQGFLWQIQSLEISLNGDSSKTAANTTALSNLDTSFVALYGRLLNSHDIENGSPVAIITLALAKKLTDSTSIPLLLDKKLSFGNRDLTVVGIVTSPRAKRAELFFPITLLSRNDLMQAPPQCVFEAVDVTSVKPLQEQITKWLRERYGDTDDFQVSTNTFRVEQASQAFAVFRVIMGLIVGISVLVGGIGVMNVLLISVTERTVEIGIRKAVGANKKDIVLQFLSESITISMFGSLLGLVVGILGTMVIIPVVKALTKAPFQAAYTLNTLAVVTILAVVIGVVFGTYPALRASKLDPVEAIRRE